METSNRNIQGTAAVRPLQFGALGLRTNLFLSPLAGYTNLPFRLTVRELGGLDLCTTDLVNVTSLLRRNPVALQLVATCARDSPLAVQLFGADPVEMRDGAQMLEAMGIASVDINMGCPVDRVVRTGSGSLLMTCHPQAAKIVAAMAGAVRIPITAKMRLGWNADSLTAPDLAVALEDAGAAAVFVHGRTRAQGFSGRVDLRGIAAVVRAVRRIPVIGNGDVTTPEAARRMFDDTGCAGVSIGRGAFYNPWIFRQTAAFLASGAIATDPGFDERVAVMSSHLDRMITFYGEAKGCMMFRKVASWYARRLGPSVFFRRRVGTFCTRAEFDTLLAEYRAWRAQFLDERGALLPRYQPGPQRSSLLDDGSDEEAPAIAVPKGPIAVW
jgi:tRNA-dihydrouridine synthase B